ncbi:MAG: protease complex subunit PrcB family protein [Lachnospiraceae bacterium]|nr:protease complex subunit PrcB family protein [Lachnospiraceae bacterium]
MKKSMFKTGRSVLILTFALFLCLLMVGCDFRQKNSEKEKVEYSVCAETEIPKELKDIIEEKKTGRFKLSYVNNDAMYIAIGYGEHNRQNLSVTVEDLFKTSNSIFVVTNLFTEEELGNQSDATASDARVSGEASMYPYIVIKCEKSELPIVFDVD